MKEITAVTEFIQIISYLLDRGRQANLEEVKIYLCNKDIIPWLRKMLPYDELNM